MNQVYPLRHKQRTIKNVRPTQKSERTADPETASPARADAGAVFVRTSFADASAAEIDGCSMILRHCEPTKKDKELIWINQQTMNDSAPKSTDKWFFSHQKKSNNNVIQPATNGFPWDCTLPHPSRLEFKRTELRGMPRTQPPENARPKQDKQGTIRGWKPNMIQYDLHWVDFLWNTMNINEPRQAMGFGSSQWQPNDPHWPVSLWRLRIHTKGVH